MKRNLTAGDSSGYGSQTIVCIPVFVFMALAISFPRRQFFYFFVLPEATVKMVGRRVSNKKSSPSVFLSHHCLYSLSLPTLLE
jgi:hypothetical protein